MARRQWVDYPATDTPLSASMLNDLEARKVEVDTQPLNVKDYGAVGNGAVDDSVAFQDCVADLPTLGGRKTGKILVPYGDYIFDSANTLDLTDTSHVEIEGLGGMSADAGRPLFQYAPSTGYFIKGYGSYGLTLRNLAIGYKHLSYASDLITFDLSGTAVSVFYPTIDRCWIGGIYGATTARSLVRLNNSIIGSIRDSHFFAAAIGILGNETTSDYSNAWKIEGCHFGHNTTAAIYNPCEAWSIDNCTFEPNSDGTPSGISNNPSVQTAKGVAIRDCWFGDISAGPGYWIDLNANGVVIEGNRLELEAGSGHTHIRLESCNGVSIVGNHVLGGDYAIQANGGTNTAVSIIGNNFTGQATGVVNGFSLSNYLVMANIGVGSLVGHSVDFLSALTIHQDMSFLAGRTIKITESGAAKMGLATLVAGAVTVSTTAVTANSRIMLTPQAPGGTPGWVRVSARTAATSFTITSSSGSDTSTVAWVMFEPA